MSDTSISLNQDKEIWLADVRRCRSPNHDRRPEGCTVDLLVIHGISLPPAEYGGGYIDQLFTNTLDPKEHPYFTTIADLRVSTHLMIDRQGNLTQYVPLNLRAWHAGESQFCGRPDCNDFSIGIELEGCDDQPYESCQYEALVKTSCLLMELFPGIDEKHIVGHNHIAPGRKTDPGPGFDWQYFFNLLNERKRSGQYDTTID